MPRVYLTQEDRATAAEARQNEILALAVRLNKGKRRVKDVELADRVGVSRGTILRLKEADAIGLAALNTVRKLAHECGLTKEDWLKMGGF